MSTLSTLKLSAASPRQQLSATDRLRRKLLEQLDLQIRAAIAMVAGGAFLLRSPTLGSTERQQRQGSDDDHPAGAALVVDQRVRHHHAVAAPGQSSHRNCRRQGFS